MFVLREGLDRLGCGLRVGVGVQQQVEGAVCDAGAEDRRQGAAFLLGVVVEGAQRGVQQFDAARFGARFQDLLEGAGCSAIAMVCPGRLRRRCSRRLMPTEAIREPASSMPIPAPSRTPTGDSSVPSAPVVASCGVFAGAVAGASGFDG
ncbi:hypothetical protein ACFQ0Q_47560 [Streptomyces aureus]